MFVPETLGDWTWQVVQELCSAGQSETDRHDFKYSLPDAATLTKLACAFANSAGGFIVLGVKDRNGHFVPEGVSPDGEIAHTFGTKVRAAPSISWESPLSLQVPGSSRLLYVFHVPHSQDRPHLPADPDRRVFWKRTNVGCEQMSIDEIRAQFMNYEERRSRLKLLLIELISNKELLSGYLDVKEGHYSLVRLDEGVLDSLLVDTYSVIQDDVELVRNLISLRIHIRTINAKIQIFFSQIALPTTGRDQLLAEQNAFLKERASFLLPIVEGCIRKLQDRYSLVPPTFES